MNIFGDNSKLNDNDDNDGGGGSSILVQPIITEHIHDNDIFNKSIQSGDGPIITLPDPATSEYNFLNYTKNIILSYDIVFKDHNGNQIGKFYSDKIQHIQFYKSSNEWKN